jgi:release factor glutamine methyltransferase
MPSSTDAWTIRKVLAWTTQHFEKRQIDAPRLTAEILLAHILNESRVRLYVDLERPLDKEELQAFRAVIERRSQGEPTQYLTGHKEFYNRRFSVGPEVLIPRPETEELAEAVLNSLPKDREAFAADICTGSGCLAVTLAAERPLLRVDATELSPQAAETARRNASTLGVSDRVSVLDGDLFAPLGSRLPCGGYDLIVSNPPYVATREIPGLSAEVRKEPVGALDGGPEGLDLLQRIVEAAPRFLKPGGLLALEIGENQGSAVRRLLERSDFCEVQVARDLSRLDRFAYGRKQG